MKLLKSVSLLALLAFLAVGWWVITLLMEAPREKAGLSASEEETLVTREIQDLLPVPVELSDTSDIEAPGPRTEMTAPSEIADGAIWIDGRVILPAGLPSDEELEIEASGNTLSNARRASRTYTTKVEQDGHFRVAFGAWTKTGGLLLNGRYTEHFTLLYLDELEGEVELEPTLGGVVCGSICPPPGVDLQSEDLEGLTVTLKHPSHPHWSSEILADGTFELTAIPPGSGYLLRIEKSATTESRHHAGAYLPNVRVVAGKVTELAVPLERGIVVSGRVIDPAGKGISAALLHVTSKREVVGAGHVTDKAIAVSHEDGTFRISGIHHGTARLTAQAEGYQDAEVDLGELDDGFVQEHLLIQQEPGRVISGVVLMPDGQPAADEEVALVLTEGGESAPSGERARTDEQGWFEFNNLGDALATLRVHVQLKVEVESHSGSTGIPPWARTPGGTLLIASQRDVPTGTEGLVLQLSDNASLRGRVQILDGSAVTDFSIRLVLLSRSYDARGLVGYVSERFHDAEGRFEISGLPAGSWELHITGVDECADSAAMIVELPRADEIVTILFPEARLTGQVLAPHGTPVAGARVGIRSTSESEGGDRDETGSSGWFELDNIPPGSAVLNIRADGFLDSEPIQLDLLQGDENPPVVVNLQAGGRLTAELLTGVDGQADYEVQVSMRASWFHETVEPDESGRFVVDGLPEGEGTASLLSRRGTDSGRSSLVVQETVNFTMPADGSTHVVFGSPPQHPIVIRGQVISGGRGVTGAVVSAQRTPGGRNSTDPFVTDRTGSYELVVDGPGERYMYVKVDDQLCITEKHEIPAGDEVRIDIQLPTASISGRVYDARGEALSEGRISVRRLGELDHTAPHSAVPWRSMYTNREGMFIVRYLEPGEYMIMVQPPGSNEWAKYAEQCVGGLNLRGGENLAVPDIVLRPGGTICGRVLPGSTKTVEAVRLGLRIQSKDGLMNRTRSAKKDGWFEFFPVPPGTYMVSAYQGNRASSPCAVVIRATETVEVELALP